MLKDLFHKHATTYRRTVVEVAYVAMHQLRHTQLSTGIKHLLNLLRIKPCFCIRLPTGTIQMHPVLRGQFTPRAFLPIHPQ